PRCIDAVNGNGTVADGSRLVARSREGVAVRLDGTALPTAQVANLAEPHDLYRTRAPKGSPERCPQPPDKRFEKRRRGVYPRRWRRQQAWIRLLRKSSGIVWRVTSRIVYWLSDSWSSLN